MIYTRFMRMSTIVAASIGTTADSRVASDLNPLCLGPRTLEKDLRYSSSFSTQVFLSIHGTHNGSPNWATLKSSSAASIALSVTLALSAAHFSLKRREEEEDGFSVEFTTGLPKYFAVIQDIWSIYMIYRPKYN